MAELPEDRLAAELLPPLAYVKSFLHGNGITSYHFQIHMTENEKFPSVNGILYVLWEDNYHDRVEGPICSEVLHEFMRRIKWKRRQNAERTADIQ